MRTPLVVGSILLLVGCSQTTMLDGDAGVDGGASLDATTERDAAIGVDAPGEPDARAPDDAGLHDAGRDDAGASTSDAAADAGSACDFYGALARGCSVDGDCTVAIHQTDCCGNSHALGMSASERARFDASEPACRASYPACGCPSGPTTTDSGETVLDDASIQVGCISRGPAGICMSYVATRPIDGV